MIGWVCMGLNLWLYSGLNLGSFSLSPIPFFPSVKPFSKYARCHAANITFPCDFDGVKQNLAATRIGLTLGPATWASLLENT